MGLKFTAAEFSSSYQYSLARTAFSLSVHYFPFSMFLTSLRKTLSVSLPQSSWPWLPLQEEAEELLLLELDEFLVDGEPWPGMGELPSPESGL